MAYTKEDKRRWLILQCRYYNGEDHAPDTSYEDGSITLWNYEATWVDFHFSEPKYLEQFKQDARIYGISLADDDKTPLTMKMLLFNRYEHWMGGYGTPEEEANSFETWYRDNYLLQRTNKERRTAERRKDLISKCRLYTGEDRTPYIHPFLQDFWLWEKEWIEMIADSLTNRDVIRDMYLEALRNETGLTLYLNEVKAYSIRINMPYTLLMLIMVKFAQKHQESILKHDIDIKFWINKYINS